VLARTDVVKSWWSLHGGKNFHLRQTAKNENHRWTQMNTDPLGVQALACAPRRAGRRKTPRTGQGI